MEIQNLGDSLLNSCGEISELGMVSPRFRETHSADRVVFLQLNRVHVMPPVP